MRILTAKDIEHLLPMATSIELMVEALARTSAGGTVQPIRSMMALPAELNALFGFMPGYIDAPACFGIKVVSAFPDRLRSGRRSHQGGVLLFEAQHGSPVALLEAGTITAIRTAAASAVATRLLARADAHTLAILGTGEQAETHMAAMPLVRSIGQVRVWGRSADKAHEFARRQSARHGIPVTATPTVAEAVAGADIICTTTAATDPLMRGDQVEAGMHLNIVGWGGLVKREIDSAVVAQSRYFVDYRPAVEAQGGDYHIALQEGAIGPDHILGEIGDLVSGKVEGRRAAHDVTLFKSVGIIAEDLVAAHYVYNRAVAENVGVEVTF